jgi:hypothetical protein
MPKIGDGTGMSGGGPEMDAYNADQDATPNSNTSPYGQGEAGKGTEKVDSHTTPFKGSK